MTALLQDRLRAAVQFAPLGDAVGNLSIGRGTVAGQPVYVALVENRIASGSLGVDECHKLAQLFHIVVTERLPLVLFLDSAGARVSQGLPALGAFRTLFRAALALPTVPAVVVLGNHCYGGASMLSQLARTRIFGPTTQLAMSGPSILAQVAGADSLDDMFRAIAQATIGVEARLKAAPANVSAADDLAVQLAQALAGPAMTIVERHVALGARLERARDALRTPADVLRRKDLERLFPDGYALCEHDGIVAGAASRDGAEISVFGLIGGRPLGAARAWHLAELALAAPDPGETVLLLDCDSHSARMEDEKVVLSEYLLHLALVLAARRKVSTIVLGKAGGGVFVAFSAAAQRLALVYGAQIQLLPGSAIASILGENRESKVEFEDYRAAGVADELLKLGLVEV